LVCKQIVFDMLSHECKIQPRNRKIKGRHGNAEKAQQARLRLRNKGRPPTNGAEKVTMYLKLRWARFFTLAGWEWTLAPKHSSFDFHVTIPCHKRCEDGDSHSLLVRICEKTYEALIAKHDDLWDIGFMYSAPHPALFGDGPKNTHWQMAHGGGGGYCGVVGWGIGLEELWERASHE
jgi:hypothetical protein